LADGTHTSTRFPNGSFVAPKFEGRAAVAWVHGDELLGSCLAHGIDNLETLVFKSESLDNSENAMAVGGCEKRVAMERDKQREKNSRMDQPTADEATTAVSYM
jgi:hypothetical protein